MLFRRADSRPDLQHPSTTSAILLDTAQGFDSYLTHLRPFLSPSTQLTIVLSHWHNDHVDGLPGVLRLLKELGAPKPRVYKFAEPGEAGRKRDQELEDKLLETLTSTESARESGAKQDLRSLVQPPERAEDALWSDETEPRAQESTSEKPAGTQGVLSRLRHGQILGGGDLPELQVLHTPGHTADSVSLLCRGVLPDLDKPSDAALESESILFTFDTVLGHGTAVFEDLRAYMSSLSTCIDTLEETGRSQPVKLFPGHGEIIEDGLAKLKEYRRHRQDREDQVIAALTGTGAAPQTAGE